jgi:hypothetical protein
MRDRQVVAVRGAADRSVVSARAMTGVDGDGAEALPERFEEPAAEAPEVGAMLGGHGLV